MENFRDSLSSLYYQDSDENDIADRSYVIHKFSSINGSDEFTLCKDGEYLVNNTGFAPENLLEKVFSLSEDNITLPDFFVKRVNLMGSSDFLMMPISAR